MSDRMDSVSFDRAAEYYDRTRAIDEESLHAMLELLARELRGRGRVLEVGVGTGALALPLAHEGIPVTGADLSRPMLTRLVEKAGGIPPVPLVQADAIRLPFADDAFGAAYLRWVLHLIPDWERALQELVRVAAPGSVLVIEPGGYSGRLREIWLRLCDQLGDPARPVGLDMTDPGDQLDEAMARSGARRRGLPPVLVPDRTTVAEFLDRVRGRCYSWTWRVPEDVLGRSLGLVGAWAEDRFGDLDTPPSGAHPLLWRAYDLPG